MRQITCGKCSRILDYSGDVPSFCAYCGQPLQRDILPETVSTDTRAIGIHPSDGDMPETIGGYRLRRRLGAGGMGVVYEAETPGTGQLVAVKLLASVEDCPPVAIERFRQEGRLASSIAHPRCVFVLAADEDHGRPYIVMELMPGDTLKDLVDRQGPLDPDQALATILDVIDGLREAHRVGVIHRDVKPSNCFLLADGRVKIGDFGLSKSLVTDLHLTQSRGFLGTPLFASPEQIKGEGIDFRTDVYSVAATLYYLLTGQAPFQQGVGAAATLARIVSEPPPPIRRIRPEVSPALERAVLRGLARDRNDRWRDLDEFRNVLLALMPGHLPFGGGSLRLGAYLIDLFLFAPLQLAGALLLGVEPRLLPWQTLVPLYLYFFLIEGIGDASLGKKALRLRVWKAGKIEPPGMARSLVRVLIHFVLIGLPLAFVQMGELSTWSLGAVAIGASILACTMRSANGYRSLHDLASGTRVIQLPQPERIQKLSRQRQSVAPMQDRSDPVPAQLGPFRISGVLRWDSKHRLLLGEDPVLGRKVWIDVRQPDDSPPEPWRSSLTRPTRLRWLTSGTHDAWSWDAYFAPSGGPLADYTSPSRPLAWHEARPILQQLTDELMAASGDSSLPAELSLEQVWVDPGGRVHLLDFPLTAASPAVFSGPDRALALLRETAVAALEGQPRSAEPHSPTIQAPLPLHAGQMVSRLLPHSSTPYRSIDEFHAELERTRSRPVQMTASVRAGILGVLAALYLPGLVVMLYASQDLTTLPESFRHFGLVHEMVEKEAVQLGQENVMLDRVVKMAMMGGAITLWPVLWVAWAFVSRGGFTLKLMGAALVRRTGRKASRLQCAWRVFLVWAPVTLLLWGAYWVNDLYPHMIWIHGGLRILAIGLFLIYLVGALLYPSRSLHDVLAGTSVVPQ